MNINVNVSWFSADRLCRSFNNPENTVKQRFEAHRRSPENPVNMQLSKDGWTEATSGGGRGVGRASGSRNVARGALGAAGAALAGGAALDAAGDVVNGAGAMAQAVAEMVG